MPPSQKPSHPSFLFVHLAAEAAAAATGFPSSSSSSSYSCCSLLSQFQSPMLLHLFPFHKKNQSKQHPTPYSSQITPLNFCPHIWSHPSPFPSTTPFPSFSLLRLLAAVGASHQQAKQNQPLSHFFFFFFFFSRYAPTKTQLLRRSRALSLARRRRPLLLLLSFPRYLSTASRRPTSL